MRSDSRDAKTRCEFVIGTRHAATATAVRWTNLCCTGSAGRIGGQFATTGWAPGRARSKPPGRFTTSGCRGGGVHCWTCGDRWSGNLARTRCSMESVAASSFHTFFGESADCALEANPRLVATWGGGRAFKTMQQRSENSKDQGVAHAPALNQ